VTRKSSNPDTASAAQPSLQEFGGVPPKLAPDGSILRENFTRERMDTLRAALARHGHRSILTHEEREENRTRFLRKWDGHSDLWIFGYGSLMWNPAIHVAETQPAKIYGLHRAFCLNLTLGRGTVENPGLMLGLDRGGSCRGMAHRVAAHQVDSETEILWMREMMGGAYRPVWIDLEFAGTHRSGPALTFAINRRHEGYAGKLKAEIIVCRIATAEGVLGTNRSYLYRTVERLDALGIGDGPMHHLCNRVRALAGD